MKHSFKRIGALLLVCLFAVSLLAACGKTGSGEADTTAEETTAEETTAEETTAEETTEELTTEKEYAGPHGEGLVWHGYVLDWEILPDDGEAAALQNETPAPDGMRYVGVQFTPQEGTIHTKDVEDHCTDLHLTDSSGNVYDHAKFTLANLSYDTENHAWYREEEQDSFHGVFTVPEDLADTDLTPISQE